MKCSVQLISTSSGQIQLCRWRSEELVCHHHMQPGSFSPSVPSACPAKMRLVRTELLIAGRKAIAWAAPIHRQPIEGAVPAL